MEVYGKKITGFGPGTNRNVLGKLGMKLAITTTKEETRNISLYWRDLAVAQVGLCRVEGGRNVERGSKINRNSVFDCHLSPHWRQMAAVNLFLLLFFYLRSSIELAFSIAAYPVCLKLPKPHELVQMLWFTVVFPNNKFWVYAYMKWDHRLFKIFC